MTKKASHDGQPHPRQAKAGTLTEPDKTRAPRRRHEPAERPAASAVSTRAESPKTASKPSTPAVSQAGTATARGPLARGPGIQIKPGKQMLYLANANFEQLRWEPGEVLNHVQIAFRELGRGKIEKPPQISLYPQRESLLTATVAFVPNVQACGLKWFSSFPNNQRLDLPQVSSLVVLSDPHTGFPIAVMDATWLVAHRGPAVSAVAARSLARQGCTTATIIGSGVQGRGHIVALADALPSLTAIMVHDQSPAQGGGGGGASKAIRWAKGQINRKIRIEPVTQLDQAVRVSDVIVSATALPDHEHGKPFVPAEWIRTGALILPLDLDAVFEPAVFEQADRFYVDSLDDLKAFHEQGLFIKAIPSNVTGQLGHLLAGKIEGRSADAEIIVCLSVGVGAIDIVLARAVFDKSCRLGVGQVLEL